MYGSVTCCAALAHVVEATVRLPFIAVKCRQLVSDVLNHTGFSSVVDKSQCM